MSDDAYPLSPTQQGMLFHWLLDRHAGVDIEQIVADLHETIDPSRLERAWQRTLATFGTLRTAFEWEDRDVPVQYIEPQASLRVCFEDLRALEPDEREGRVASYLREDRHEGFDLCRAPLMRVALFRMADAHFRMVWSFHHILLDGRAFELVLGELFHSYEGDQPRVAADRPYRRYIDWIGRQRLDTARAFWREKLRGFTATTPLPAGHAPLPETGLERLGQKEIEIPVAVTERLRELAAREDLSLNTLIMSVWALLLSRYTGEQEVVFGATKTTRRGTIADAEAVVGLFLATIPVRIRVDQDLSVLAFIRQVRDQWRAIRGNEHLPLVDIKQVSDLPPSAPLFETLLVAEYYRFGTRLRARGGVWSSRQFRIVEETNYPLNLFAYGDPAMAVKIEYDARRFDAATIDRMLGHVMTVLTSWANDTSGPLWQSRLLTAAERLQMLEGWNDTARDYPRATPLAELLEAQAARTPDAPAATFGQETLSYRELNVRANRLAAELRKHDVGPDRLVGISVERSLEMMVALLAVLKTGGAYVPLDPFFPPDRIAYMMADSGIRVLVTQRSLRKALPPFAGTVVDLDDGGWRANDGESVRVAVGPSSLAYVIYTSGSTGKPKGVQVLRGALTNFLWAMRELLGLGPGDRVLAVTTISFDIAGMEVWLPWLVGAHTIVATREAAADGQQLSALLTRHDITFLQATPVTGRLLLATGWPGKANLDLALGGEALPPDLAAGLVPRVRRLWNLYGPTETTVWSTAELLREGEGPILIGRPIANTRCYVLDEYRQPIPLGAVGELFIGGDGVARGYLNRPELTAEKFVDDPFVADGVARMYRTGDLARFWPDGRLECLGRTDQQVKVRGFRIEPGEIEALMKQVPGVAEAVVVAREDVPGDRRLVGYVVRHGGDLDVAALRTHLKRSLPDYMVPSAFVRLDRMPLTANGKIDRRALPAPERGAAAPGPAGVMARTHVEKQLSDIWEEIFDVPAVSVDANFFDLGGHSLLAVKLMNRIARVFGQDLPLNTLFESPTIEMLATHLEAGERSIGSHSLVRIQASGSRAPLFWIPGGAALGLFRLRPLVTALGPEQPVYGLGSSVPKSVEEIETVEERAAAYLKLVREIEPRGPVCLAGFCAGGLVAFELAQRLLADGQEVPFVGLIDCLVPQFPLGRLDTLVLRGQRLRRQLRAARAEGLGVTGWVRKKAAERREARQAAAEAAAAASQVKASGFDRDSVGHHQLLLDEVDRVFARYEPRAYPGPVALFMPQDPDYVGVSPRFDPRFAWARWAAQHEVWALPGGHHFVPEAVAVFKHALEAALDRRAATHV